MADPKSKNLDMYGHEALPWSRVEKALEASHENAMFWLATTRPDGRPHLNGFFGMWVDGKLYFVTGAGTIKGRNLAANPSCTVGTRLPGIDITIDGTAERITDQATLTRLAGKCNEAGWPLTVEGDALTGPYNAQSAGPAPWSLYEITPKTVVGLGTEDPSGATRWTLE